MLTVLWLMAILGVMASSLFLEVRLENHIERRVLTASSLRYVARAGLHRAVAAMKPHANKGLFSLKVPWVAEVARPWPWTLGTGVFSAPEKWLDDAESRLNINVATPEQLMRFPGISTVAAEAMVLYRLKKTEKEKTPGSQGLNKSAGVVNGPIRDLMELATVKGVDDGLLFTGTGPDHPPLSTFLTTASSGRVNLNTASMAVLLALGFSESDVNVIVAERQTTGVAFHAVDQVSPRLKMPDNVWNKIKPFVDIGSRTFHLNGQARSEEGGSVLHVAATAQFNRGQVRILTWREH